MGCPYLQTDTDRKVCRQMVEQGLDGEIDDFDVIHYCRGNPNHCFFFRFYHRGTQTTAQLEEDGSEACLSDLPLVPDTSVLLTDPQPDEPSSKQFDKLLKLKRIIRHIV